jgi:predicted transposase/invertase (TIGR01784 family)
MEIYEREWMRISNEKAMLGASYDEGVEKGIKIGKEEGKEEAKAEAEMEAQAKIEANRRTVAKNLKAMGMPTDQISAATGLSVEEIERL